MFRNLDTESATRVVLGVFGSVLTLKGLGRRGLFGLIQAAGGAGLLALAIAERDDDGGRGREPGSRPTSPESEARESFGEGMGISEEEREFAAFGGERAHAASCPTGRPQLEPARAGFQASPPPQPHPLPGGLSSL